MTLTKKPFENIVGKLENAGTYTNLSLFCFLGTIPVLVQNVWAYENSKVKPRLHRAIADKLVVFLTKVGMEPTKTYLL